VYDLTLPTRTLGGTALGVPVAAIGAWAIDQAFAISNRTSKP
jgi:hypothetical protein